MLLDLSGDGDGDEVDLWQRGEHKICRRPNIEIAKLRFARQVSRFALNLLFPSISWH